MADKLTSPHAKDTASSRQDGDGNRNQNEILLAATVLCIDDDAGVLGMYRARLEGRGYTVLTAPDGATGIAISRKHSVDAVVLDFNMTGMDGYQAAAVFMKEQPTLPVVICSGSADLPESLKWFADGLVQKGDGSGALLAAIEKVIGLRTETDRLVQ